ncbi:hypothetical protein HF295_06165 [Hujiaoplasma nucleasis]|uniref:Uncharacterized protein n=1 Tax=Hujiaoplasma nucleasis TaxID=2725268 RepID=A0A7L6N7E7_9MOLU|nr:hypothetical protein [Hujiaoplasma nucleasis]QLY40454.1 hypothetical protein HF295_06165 [Hujiaoplasma nucleasis]
MPVFYIINQSGLLKQYYSVKNALSHVNEMDPVIYSVSLRNAKTFLSYDEANQIIVSRKLFGCFIINENGIQQNG